MNTKTYCHKIAKDFGGLMKAELYEKLLKLVELAKAEQRNVFYEREREEARKVRKEIIEDTVSLYEDIGKRKPTTPYDKALKLIKDLNNKGWQHISVIPDELFQEFWKISDMHREIIYDEERDYQYFRIEDFHSRSLEDIYKIVEGVK